LVRSDDFGASCQAAPHTKIQYFPNFRIMENLEELQTACRRETFLPRNLGIFDADVIKDETKVTGDIQPGSIPARRMLL
jgi:hypothetical protein